MLDNLFQQSDNVLFMESAPDKTPFGARLGSAEGPIDPALTYFAINPIDAISNRNQSGKRSIRASINVSAYRNFLFEIDSLSLDAQLALLTHLHTAIPLAQVTFSGASSYHAIISVADTLPFRAHTDAGIMQYSMAWRALNLELTELASNFLGPDCPTTVFDQACKDPARLSRTPGVPRPDTLQLQAELSGFGGYVSSDFILGLMSKHRLNEATPAPRLPMADSMDMQQFKLRLLFPENLGLSSKLKNVKAWASSENMYPALFQLTLWIIDSLGAPYDTTLQYMSENVFPSLRVAGYPRNPEIPIYNAYSWKGLT
jgi:hypothetical protein